MKKSTKIVVDATPEEKSSVREYAAGAGKSMSEFLLTCMRRLETLDKFSEDNKLTVVDPKTGKPVTLMFV